MLKIGVFGGSFNPVHKEHINVAVNAMKVFSLDKLIVIPTFISPHKSGFTLAPAKDRLKMLEIAFKGFKNIEVSDYEIKKGGVSYTYVTLEHLKNTLDCELYLIMGADMLLDFATWREPERILRSAKPIVAPRENDDLLKALSVFYGKFGFRPAVSTYVGKNVSSTNIRNRLTLGLDVSSFLDERVEEYIKERGLYSGENARYADYVIKSLNKKRLEHTAGVMTLAEKYAKRLKADVKKANLAAMMHDVAKYKTYEEYGLIAPDGVPKNVLHQFLGEYICRNVLNIEDEEVLNAVKYHTTGRAAMSDMEKIIFLADLLEAGRNYDGADTLRKAVDEDFDKGFKLCIAELFGFLTRSLPDGDVYYLTKECKEYYCD